MRHIPKVKALCITLLKPALYIIGNPHYRATTIIPILENATGNGSLESESEIA